MSITQSITALSNVPTTADPANFATKADTFLGTALPGMVTELNTFATQANTLAAGMNAAATGGALAVGYTFSTTTTDSDPGAGTLRLNNATQNTATVIRADLLDTNGVDWTTILDAMDDSTSTIKGFLKLEKASDGTKYILWSIASVATVSGYRNITVSPVAWSAANPFTNGDTLTLQFTRTGDKGDTGATGAAGALAGTATGDINMADYTLSRAMLKDIGGVAPDKGNSGTSTQTLDYTAGSHQKITATGSHTIATSNWPPTGNTGMILLELVNGGAYTITWPTINWIKPDGATTTSMSTYLAANTGRTALQTSGTDFVLLWSRDGGTTIYGELV